MTASIGIDIGVLFAGEVANCGGGVEEEAYGM